ncbi:MAG: YciI family protein [Chloroflexota bacterium]|nr:YciI family protein [Chloroflexota bacterium]
MAKFAAIVTFGDAEKRMEARPRHRAYLQQLLAEGKLHESGPWADDSGALIIYEAADQPEAQALLDADPYTAVDGIITDVRLLEWNRIFSA